MKYSVSDSAMAIVSLDTTPIELHLGSILEATLEVKEKVLIRHAGNLKNKDSELIDAVAEPTRLLVLMKARPHFFLNIARGMVLLEFTLKIYPCVDCVDAFAHFTMFSMPPQLCGVL